MPQPSIRNLQALRDVDALRSLLQSLAILDAIMSPDWEDRFFSFDAQWSPGEQMGSMRDGSGDGFFALFSDDGCFLKGFVHEAPMTPWRTDPPALWPGLLDGAPDEFSSAKEEPAFSMDEVTLCIWRRYADSEWLHGPVRLPDDDDPDGSEYLFCLLDADPQTYCEFAEDYYEESIPVEAVRHVYGHRPLTDEVVASLNDDVLLKDLAEDIGEIGFLVRRS